MDRSGNDGDDADGAGASAASPRKPLPPKAIAASALGNAMDYYDFAVYGFLAPTIAPLFFPAEDHFTSVLAVYGAFAVGFLARPIGGLVFGYFGDRFGRRQLLMVTIAMMGFSSLAIGLLPTADSIGTLAGVLLVLLRLFQGFALAGEGPGAMVFVAEGAPPHRRGFLCGIVIAGAQFGFLIGSGVAGIFLHVFTQDQLADGLWRIPFILGIIPIGICFFLRRASFHEYEPKAVEGVPLLRDFRIHARSMVQIVGLTMPFAVTFYALFVYTVSYLIEIKHLPGAVTMDINTAALFTVMMVLPFAGMLSDKIGRRPVSMFGALALFLSAYPLYTLITTGELPLILLGQLAIAVFLGMNEVVAITMNELARPEARVSVLALAFNVSMAVFGGTTPVIVTYLTQRTGQDVIPAFYIMIAAAIGFAALLTVRETKGRPMGIR